MEINGHNTQLASMDDVHYYCGNNNHLKLRIKRNERQESEIEIDGKKDNFADYNLGIGLCFKDVKPNSYGFKIGIRENDHLISVSFFS